MLFEGQPCINLHSYQLTMRIPFRLKLTSRCYHFVNLCYFNGHMMLIPHSCFILGAFLKYFSDVYLAIGGSFMNGLLLPFLGWFVFPFEFTVSVAVASIFFQCIISSDTPNISPTSWVKTLSLWEPIMSNHRSASSLIHSFFHQPLFWGLGGRKLFIFQTLCKVS